MPDDLGRLSPEEMKDLVRRFEEFDRKRGGDLKCEVCDSIHWHINSALIGMRSDAPTLGPHVRTPSVAIVCSNCGNMKFFAAALMGIEIQDFAKKKKPPSAPAETVDPTPKDK